MSAEKPVIVMTGGGTGGHITPILALAEEVKALDPRVTVVYIGEKGGKFDELTKGHPAIDQTFAISAGKLRRYHGESWLRRMLDIKTNLLNFRDIFRFLAGVRQAKRILQEVKPELVFQKGGFVGVPVSIAASRRHIPIVTHDSDTLPGLANRIVGRWAVLHATGYPAEFYTYPKDKMLHVGVLVSKAYQAVSPELQRESKLKLGLNPDEPLILITGGSSGAGTINKAVLHSIATLLQNHSTVQIIHQVGKGKADVYKGFTHERLKVLEFLNPMVDYTTAADIIVTRAGANAMAEFGVQGKACIVVPAAHLTGGHQLTNGKLLEEKGAAIIVPEDELYDSQHGLFAAITKLLIDPKLRQQLGRNLQAQTIPNAAHRLAVALLEQTKLQNHETTQTKA
jgi:UDP-N-acetylglucosamine--N-acetylmuramyl-(pentapeptide) pyrophosphoryl-undecaprenol N-acetylglucosamine transferase